MTREQIKEFASKVKRDTLPFGLARALREVRDDKTHRDWGYRTFKEYVRDDLGWCKARAYHLIRLLEEFERIGMSEREMSELGAVLGWSKCLDLLPVLTRENKDRLVYDAMTMPQRKLREHIKNLRQYVRKAA